MSKSNLPSLQELVDENEVAIKENNLMVLLNQPPPEKWLTSHPIIVGHRYLPIQRVEWLLSRIFTKWWVEVLDTQILANSIVCTVRLFVVNPLTGEVMHNDGVGASPIQTKKGAGAMDWNQAQSSGVQMAAPSAKSYAFKDAAESFGKLFGKDASRKSQIDYDSLLRKTDNDDLTPVDDEVFDSIKRGIIGKTTTLEEVKEYYKLTPNQEAELVELNK